MQCLKHPGGRETTDPAETSSLSFFEDLFRDEDRDKSAGDEHLQDLKRLGEEEAFRLQHFLS